MQKRNGNFYRELQMNIKELAEQCWEGESPKNFNISKFAELVAAHEREECANLCFAIANTQSNVILGVAVQCADAIRARSKA